MTAGRRGDGPGNQFSIIGSHLTMRNDGTGMGWGTKSKLWDGPTMGNDGVTARGRVGEPTPYRGIASHDGELRRGDEVGNQITMRG